MDERQAIRRLKNGDISGLAALVEHYQHRALRAAFLVTHDAALAEDLVQSAFVRAYQSIHQFDANRPFGPWFLRSVVNAALQMVQREDRQVSLDDPLPDAESSLADFLADTNPGPSDLAEDDEFKERVRGALEQLSPEQRAAVVLRYYLDLSESEMASAMKVPPGTVKWRLHTARNQLRVLLRHIVRAEPGWKEG